MSEISTEAPVATSWPESCRAFFDHWRAERGDEIMPTSEHFLDVMPATFVSRIYIAEVTALDTVVRYQGSEFEKRWGVDLTGQEMAAHQPQSLRAQLHQIMNVVAGFPCGYFSNSRFLTSRQRLLEVWMVRLPLAVQPGRPYRVVNYAAQHEVLGEAEVALHEFETLASTWFDIGAGVPGQPPGRLRA